MAGTVVTFYSYKGGVGRSFAVANVAVILAQWGFRVLAVDWDIEAPGLHHFFSELAPTLALGTLDFLDDCIRGKAQSWQAYASALNLTDTNGTLFLMPAAAGGGADYADRVQSLDWDELYQKYDFGARLERLRSEWTDAFDIILVDSRTGLTDFTGVTTVQLPDVLAFLFTANNQSLTGCCDIARRAMDARKRLPIDRPAIIPLPIVARFEQREEYDRAQHWRSRFASLLETFYATWAPPNTDQLRLVDLLTIPYVARWTFGEDLCGLLEPPGVNGTRTTSQAASYALETISAILATAFNKIELLTKSRDEYVLTARASAAARLEGGRRPRVFISSSQATSNIADVLRDHLIKHDFDVSSPKDIEASSGWSSAISAMIEKADACVAVFGEPSEDKLQDYEVEQFLRSSLRTDVRKLIVPVVTSMGLEQWKASRLADHQPLLVEPLKAPLEPQFDPLLSRLQELHGSSPL